MTTSSISTPGVWRSQKTERRRLLLPFDRLAIGAKVRVIPNHVCMTAAAYGAYTVVDGGTEIIDTWGRCNGW